MADGEELFQLANIARSEMVESLAERDDGLLEEYFSKGDEEGERLPVEVGSSSQQTWW